MEILRVGLIFNKKSLYVEMFWRNFVESFVIEDYISTCTYIMLYLLKEFYARFKTSNLINLVQLYCNLKYIIINNEDQKVISLIAFLLGVGFASMMVSFLVCVYYNIIIAWCLYYLFLSMAKDVPWKSCGNWWNTDKCLAGPVPESSCSAVANSTAALLNGTAAMANSTASFANATVTNCTEALDFSSPPLEYWE